MQIRQQQSQRPRMPPKPRPAPKPKTSPKARVLYDYQAGDNDEITLAEGEQVEVKTKAFLFIKSESNLFRFSKRIQTVGSWCAKAAVAVYSREIILKKLAHDFETDQCPFFIYNCQLCFSLYISSSLTVMYSAKTFQLNKETFNQSTKKNENRNVPVQFPSIFLNIALDACSKPQMTLFFF